MLYHILQRIICKLHERANCVDSLAELQQLIQNIAKANVPIYFNDLFAIARANRFLVTNIPKT